MPTERRRLIVKGVVQGVGFRPFVWRLAAGLGLGGWVSNRGDAGVEIQIEGETAAITSFLHALREDLPPLARVASVEMSPVAPIGETAFSIAASREGGAGAGSIPPDVAVCDRCVEDLLRQTRYHGYWATTCTDCGPRFTVIESLPYDRPRTSMEDFPMCPNCEREYSSPLDRRYHAQTIACPACGPRLLFDGEPGDAIECARAALEAGRIVAIKGIGGTHLACDATDDRAVQTLRERLGRPGQPFALMATRPMIARIALVSPEEQILLESPRRPIVVLRRLPGVLSEKISPGLHTIGVMLPYTGLQQLLFQSFEKPLVMTSANFPGRPMLIDNQAIRELLVGIADHSLLHDRRIVARCDDSVVRQSGGTTKLLRRSRGYVPEPIAIDLGQETIVALGPESDVTFALYSNGTATLSQHIGCVDNLETLAFLRDALDHQERLLHAPAPAVIACDLHPSFLTTRLAEDLAERTGARLVRVQHHEAHAAAILAEHALDEAVTIVLDGFGYGRDGGAWGGEVFLTKKGTMKRVGSLAPVLLQLPFELSKRHHRFARRHTGGRQRGRRDPSLAHGVGQQGVCQPRAPALVRRNDFRHNPIAVGD